AQHCECADLVKGGVIHDGRYAREHSLPGICSECEWRMIERDLRLCAKTNVHYHVCHISTKESVSLIRQAKKAGINVTCETAPHYLTLCEDDLRDEGRFKMNPPLRSAQDREALIEGICDGTVDMIATDHAPHSKQEKQGGLRNSLMGITGLETAFPVLYTHLVKTRVITLEKLIDLMSCAPARIFGINTAGCVSVLDTGTRFTVDPDRFISLGKSTPFEGAALYGKTLMTVVGGEIVFDGREDTHGKEQQQ
ncbi:MAG TPA: amidohydrolase family protein, partial [Bacillota bacterium]|nr:amidohydrolase family protein [Bacillota bacterium]